MKETKNKSNIDQSIIPQSLSAISPIDGRYAHELVELRPLFSEYALIYYRLFIEIRWFEVLAKEKAIKELPPLSKSSKDFLQNILDCFSEKEAVAIKAIENTVKHDVKAVEYFLKEKMQGHKALKPYIEFIHFSCTSEDINNLAYGLILKSAKEKIIFAQLKKIIAVLVKMSNDFSRIPMLAKTHGQTATPTTLGKEISNFVARLKRQQTQLSHIEIMGKINGAVGNYNAHVITYPDIDWQKFSKHFIESLDLTFNAYTTQIEPHDYIAELSHLCFRINTILIDLSRDIWMYISNGTFKQKSVVGEVGSSTMPHKINPIDFENAEGNLGIANALFQHFAEKLPISRWQRDLSDSTVLRNLGVSFGHMLLAFKSINKGLNKLEPNIDLLEKELQKHPEVLAEAIQTVMRKYHIDAPYEKLKTLTRGKTLSKKQFDQFIDTLDIPEKIKTDLKALTPKNYLGIAEKLAKEIKT